LDLQQRLVTLEVTELLARLVLKEPRVKQERLGLLVKLVWLVKLELQDLREKLELVVCLVCLVSLERQESLARRVWLERLESLARLERVVL
jgi:hypothetical protein